MPIHWVSSWARLNAAGRIGSAMDGPALLTSHDKGHAVQLAQSLEEMNEAPGHRTGHG